jgi:hypothetical protein
MNLVFATLALLGLLVAVAGVVWQVGAADFEAWTPEIVVVLVERAVRVLPPDERDIRREEWLTEIGELPSRAIISKVVVAWDLRRAAKKLARGNAVGSGSALPFWLRPTRSIKAHRADLQLQEWLSADRQSLDRLLSYLFCLVIYEEHEQSVGAAAKAMGCNGNTIHAGILHLERLLGEQLLCQDTGRSLTRLGSDIAKGAQPLIWSMFDDHAGRLTQVDRRHVINSIINGFSGYISEEDRIRLPSAEIGGLQMRLFDLGPAYTPLGPKPKPKEPSVDGATGVERTTSIGDVQPIE